MFEKKAFMRDTFPGQDLHGVRCIGYTRVRQNKLLDGNGNVQETQQKKKNKIDSFVWSQRDR